MNNGGRIAFVLFSAGIYGALVSTLVATGLIDLQSRQATLPVLLFDLKLIGFFIAVPAFALGGIGGAILLKLRTLLSHRFASVLSGAGLGGALGIVFVWLATLFDPTTVSNAPGNSPMWKVLVF